VPEAEVNLRKKLKLKLVQFKQQQQVSANPATAGCQIRKRGTRQMRLALLNNVLGIG